MDEKSGERVRGGLAREEEESDASAVRETDCRERKEIGEMGGEAAAKPDMLSPTRLIPALS